MKEEDESLIPQSLPHSSLWTIHEFIERERGRKKKSGRKGKILKSEREKNQNKNQEKRGHPFLESLAPHEE